MNLFGKNSRELMLDSREQRIKEDEDELQKQHQEIEKEYKRLKKKEDEVKTLLLQYHQYMEIPDDKGWGAQDTKGDFDKEITQLLDEKVEVIYDKLAQNKYKEKEVFRNDLLVTDFVDLIESVARIHNPNSKHPLLETSIENLLRSINRLSLQLLVLIDNFPIDIKSWNINKTYSNVEKAAKSYGYYKKIAPFMTYAAPVFRIGMAANPLVGVAQTVAVEAGKHGVKKVAGNYSLKLFHDFFGIIGDQATTIFGKEPQRYRSKHWYFALELTEIIYYFHPVDREALSKAMKVVGGLLIRNEYDRLFLNNCLVNGRTGNPKKIGDKIFNDNDKKEMARKLQDFIENYINEERKESVEKKVVKWRKDVEKRIGIKLQLNLDKNEPKLLKEILNKDSAEKKIKPFLARDILLRMEDEEKPQFIYKDIKLELDGDSPKLSQLWLVGTDRKLLLLSVDGNDEVKLVWTFDAVNHKKLSVERKKNVLNDDCLLSGGEWVEESGL
ncbi:MAG: hypothetical protein HOF24_03165, partial [Flavobacteriaceae bacterium]|nr:hypothetical protein [Flavobacteriaceae bacterium]